jgi:ribosome-binding ATPase YchF (GTP1/OBG family)
VTVVRQEITKAVVNELLLIDEEFIGRLLKEAERQVRADSSEADPQAARDGKLLREVERKISNLLAQTDRFSRLGRWEAQNKCG